MVEVLWKAISIIIYQNLVESIDFHDIMHRFRFWRGIGTATLEAKILQKIAGIRQEVLYDIFVDIHMAYDDLDWGACPGDTGRVRGGGVGPQV